MMNYIALFTFIFNVTFLMPSFAAAENQTVNPVQQEEKSCEQHQQEIKQSCSENPSFQEAQTQRNVTPKVDDGQSATAQAQTLQLQNREISSSKTSLDAAREQCRAAAEACWGRCEAESKQHKQQGDNYMNVKPVPQTAAAQQEYTKQSTADNNKNYCKKEAEKSMEEMKKASMDLSQLIQAIASLLQALGVGQDGEEEVALTDPEEEEGDPCEGENASLLIECAGESDPIGTRASVSGSTGVGDLSGGNGQDLMGQPAQGDSDDDSGSNGGSNFPGGQFAASGGLAPFGDSPGSSVGAASNGQDKLNTDIHKGYMGGGDGGFGSFSGGGGGAARSSGSSLNPFSRTASDDGRKKLQSALDKVASAGRGPASEGTNGPFQNIWGVVTQTYKKTSPSMFHKE